MNKKPQTGWRAGTENMLDDLANAAIWNNKVVRIALTCLSALILIGLVTMPLGFWSQLVFALCLLGTALIVRRIPGRLISFFLILLSLTASFRYMWWRLNHTLDFQTTADAFFGYGLLLAELYALVVLVLGYIQTAWPLQRKPIALPADHETWPTVDILIPTYNEPLDIVRQTIYAALAQDWPSDKFHVYLLDDGRRQEFREFCEEVGCGYMTRENNQYAKAGNLNAALERTGSEYVAIFDCDHIPTRSFLQLTMGQFLRDDKLAILQTPHFFFSPDPFERNLNTYHSTPNEGDLFYGVVQDGNDLWNASFFCGSCAILRRNMLEEIGGIAIETVTEDAHTALKLSRKGYNTAYLGIPMAAGLATESLSAHVGQRIRWARGMAQIARTDNPLLGPGLKFGQRLCYLNAMLHFFYGLPRLVFLTAPLAFLFFGAHVFEASALMIAVYALPHIIQSNLTNSRLQGRFRYSFWNEIYESVLAWYIMLPVLVAFINPKYGQFNVTAKGGKIEKSYFDIGIAKPYVVLLALNLAGMVVGIIMLFNTSNDTNQTMTIVMNLLWSLFNLILTGASVAVASEARQIRNSPRVAAELPAMVRTPDGRAYPCQTRDFSEQGLGLEIMPGLDIPVGSSLEITLRRGDEETAIPVTAVMRKGSLLGVKIDDLSPEQRFSYTQMTFARADLWIREWGNKKPDAPLRALREIINIGVKGLGIFGRYTHASLLGWMQQRQQQGKDASSSTLNSEK
ncbi:UDP-forming cellulose synthase catalytic subunit [Kerstersia sp.]|uniref:UDP-forming cellulose synthase catalytic subunit n=1 Tax=Kerstersia sp. TaxID=1930783 RepID=UPI003F91A491